MRSCSFAIALLVACLLVSGSQGLGPCAVVPAPGVIHVKSSPSYDLMGNTAQLLVTNELNGPNMANTANLIIPPGSGFPPHRHPGTEEYMYFTEGEGELTIWYPGQKSKSTLKVKAGDLHYTPLGGIHEVRNTGKKNMAAITWVSPGPILLEPLAKWPESLDEPVGRVVHIVGALKGACPPGHEPTQDANDDDHTAEL